MSDPERANPYPRADDPCRVEGRYKKIAVREVQVQLRSMHDAVEDALVWPGRKAFWCQYWEFQVLHAADREFANRDYERWGRFGALVLVLGVTALTSVSVFADGPSATWLGVSAAVVAWLAAIAAGALGIFRYGDRWSAYHTVRTGLMTAGWDYVNATSGDRSDRELAWATFVKDTEAVMAAEEQRNASLTRPQDSENDGLPQ